MSAYTLRNLREVEDQAAKHGLGPAFEARFPFRELDADETGLSLQRLAPGERMPFAHRHDEAEEICVVLTGSGEALVDGDVVPVAAAVALRLAPSVVRPYAAGPEGMEYLIFGPRREQDSTQSQADWPAGRPPAGRARPRRRPGRLARDLAVLPGDRRGRRDLRVPLGRHGGGGT